MDLIRQDICDLTDAIDSEWIDEYNNLEKDYNKFYKDSQKDIMINLLFINKNNEITHIKQEKINIEPNNTITRNDLVSIIYKNKNKNKYKLYSILKYNFNIDQNELNLLFNNNVNTNEYLRKQSYISDITFEDTIHVFHEINAIYIFFKEITKKDKNTPQTKRHKKIICRNTRRRNK